jgi:hypothetical protein
MSLARKFGFVFIPNPNIPLVCFRGVGLDVSRNILGDQIGYEGLGG